MTGKMRGLVKEEAGIGEVVLHNDLPIPQINDDEVLVKIRCAAICGTDLHTQDEWDAYAQKWIKPPVIPGHETVGDIVEIGKNVKDRKVGDRVAIEPYITCGECYSCTHGMPHLCTNLKIFGITCDGAYAEYAKIPASCTYKIGDNLSYEAACLLQPNATGVHGAEVAEPEGKTVLVVGCGSLGLTAVATCKTFGATKVISADLVEDKLQIAPKMGADVIINSGKEDLVKRVLEETNGVGVDAAIDVSGSQFAINQELKCLRPKGRLVCVALPTKPVTINDFSNDLIYREIELTGISGRLIWRTWEDFEKVMNGPYYKLEYVLGGRYALEDVHNALEAMRKGVPGKVILYPFKEDLKNKENFK